MSILTRACLSSALTLALLGLGVADSTAVASQLTRSLREPQRAPLVANHPDTGAGSPLNRTIEVQRAGLPTISFVNDDAVASNLTSTRAKIGNLETALGRDLSQGTFRARQTLRAVRAVDESDARSTSEELVLAQRELTRLKAALREDLASGDFCAPHTRAEVAQDRESSPGTGEGALASGAVTVSDDLLGLEAALESDIHTGAFKAVETHFTIDGRRWKVN